MEDDLVSIITPSYNTSRYIGKTIESVLAQTYANWELLIVDDCSTDDTDAVVARYSDERIRYFKNERNSGAAVARNKALREACGRWIAFLDSDDLWDSEKLERQLRFMRENACSFSYTEYREVDGDGVPIGSVVSGPKRITTTGFFNYCWVGCLTVMYDASVVGLIQVAPLKKNNDYAIWLKATKKAECRLLPEILASYRKGRAGSITKQTYFSVLKWHYLLYVDGEGQCKLRAAFNAVRNMFFGVYKKLRYVRRRG